MSSAQERPSGPAGTGPAGTGAAGTGAAGTGTAGTGAAGTGAAGTGAAGTGAGGPAEPAGVPGQRGGAHRTTGYEEGYRESAEYERYEGGTAASLGGATLAAVLMIFTGLVGFFEGIVGLIHGSFYVVHPNYVFTVGSWGRGLTQLILGAVIFAAGVCLLLGMMWARVVGIVLAVLYGIASFMFLPWYPIWSIIMIALNVFIIWALATMGRYRVA
jgi:hypothetical protein